MLTDRMNNQRLRNLTTGILHTKMDDIYKDVEYLTGERGVMTHMLPNAFKAMQTFLQERLTDARFWDGQFDTTHDGETEIAPMTPQEARDFWQRFGALPSPFAGLV